jgi:hypothetical protein
VDAIGDLESGAGGTAFIGPIVAAHSTAARRAAGSLLADA